MGFPPYEVFGTSIPTNVGWGGPKVIIGMLLWPIYPTRYCTNKGWPYMVAGPPNKGKYQQYSVVFHTSVLEEEKVLTVGAWIQLVHW